MIPDILCALGVVVGASALIWTLTSDEWAGLDHDDYLDRMGDALTRGESRW